MVYAKLFQLCLGYVVIFGWFMLTISFQYLRDSGSAGGRQNGVNMIDRSAA